MGAVALALSFSFIFSGCMPYTELKEESIVEGVGVDSDSNGGYILTFQIFNPQQGGGGGQGGKSSTSEQVKILQSSGATLFDAIRNATLQVGRKLYFSNNRAYVIGEDVCKSGISKILDFMERNEQIKPTEHMYVAKGKASDILTFKKDGQYIPAENFDEMSENSIQTSKLVDVELLETYKDVSNGIIDPVLPVATIQADESGENILELDGTAIFRDNKLVGFLNSNETRGYLWIDGKVQGGVIHFDLPQGGTASMAILSSSSKIKAQNNSGTPSISVNVKLSTKISEIESSKSLIINEKLISKLKTLQENVVKTETKAAIDTAVKTYGADIFGFGMNLYESQPTLWRKLGVDWSKNSQSLNIQINVDSSIDHTGLLGKT